MNSLVQLGKFGAFPASELLGLHYDITYEIHPSGPSSASRPQTPTPVENDNVAADEEGEGNGIGIGIGIGNQSGSTSASTGLFGQMKGKKNKKGKGKDGSSGNGVKSNPGWNNILRPLKRQPIVDAVIGGSFVL